MSRTFFEVRSGTSGLCNSERKVEYTDNGETCGSGGEDSALFSEKLANDD
jgi:hypothetical protein